MQLVAERVEQCFRIEWLLEPAVDAVRAHVDMHLLRPRAADGEQLQVAVVGIAADGRDCPAAVEAWHAHIEQHDLRFFLGEANHGLQAVGGRVDVEAAHAEAAGEQLALVVIIFNDECRVMYLVRTGDAHFWLRGLGLTLPVVELVFDLLELVEDLEDRSLGVAEVVHLNLLMQQVQAEGCGVEAIASRMVQLGCECFRGRRKLDRLASPLSSIRSETS